MWNIPPGTIIMIIVMAIILYIQTSWEYSNATSFSKVSGADHSSYQLLSLQFRMKQIKITNEFLVEKCAYSREVVYCGTPSTDKYTSDLKTVFYVTGKIFSDFFSLSSGMKFCEVEKMLMLLALKFWKTYIWVRCWMLKTISGKKKSQTNGVYAMLDFNFPTHSHVKNVC